MRVDHSLRLDVPEGPCEAFDCELSAQCKAEKLACPGFRAFVSTGRRQVPWPDHASREIYDEVFTSEDRDYTKR